MNRSRASIAASPFWVPNGLGSILALFVLASPLGAACGGVSSVEDDCTIACDDNATCVTDASGSMCRCNNGYAGDGETCADLDECRDQTDDCDLNAECTNTEGGFTCACNSGFSGDGRVCTSPGVWRYDFEELTVGADLATQDGWYAGFTSGSPSVVGLGATPVNMTKLVTIEAGSAGSVSRINGGGFVFGPFTGTETNAYLQIDFRWNRADDANGASLRIGNDRDLDGNISFEEGVAIRVQDGRYGFDNSNVGPSAGRDGLGAGTTADWYRMRLVMDFASDTGTLLYQNLTRGDSTFSLAVSGPLELNTLAPGAEAARWNTIEIFSNERTEWDNLEIGLSE